jgi:dihydroorotase
LNTSPPLMPLSLFKAASDVAATVTAHHLLYNRNDLLVGGIKPHLFCLPVLNGTGIKPRWAAVTSGHPRFFWAPIQHRIPVSDKESSCGCAGCYTAHAALELYAEVFEEEGARSTGSFRQF